MVIVFHCRYFSKINVYVVVVLTRNNKCVDIYNFVNMKCNRDLISCHILPYHICTAGDLEQPVSQISYV